MLPNASIDASNNASIIAGGFSSSVIEAAVGLARLRLAAERRDDALSLLHASLSLRLRRCCQCGQPLTGRVGKVYCSPACTSSHHYHSAHPEAKYRRRGRMATLSLSARTQQ